MTIIGIDVSKAKLDCLWIRDLTAMKVKSKVHPNTVAGHRALVAWAIKHAGNAITDVHFVMEATGVYHDTLAHALYDAGAQVSIINPARIRYYAASLGAQSKTDRKDSVVIAHFGMTQSPELWTPEPREVRALKALIARCDAIKQDVQREANRLEKATVSDVSTDVRTSIETVREQLVAEQKRLESLIDDHIDRHPGLKHDRELLESIPAIGPVLSQAMIAVLRSRPFTSASSCGAFVGLRPVERVSGTSVYAPPRMSKQGDSTVRKKLYMAALVAIRHNPDIKCQYQRLVRNGKHKMSAIGAAMRKLVHICFGVLKHQTMYQPQVAETAA